MSWQRLIHRNGATGDYGNAEHWGGGGDYYRQLFAGDARRMERDQRDERHLRRYAEATGITPEQAKAVLDLFLDADCEGQTYAGKE